MKKQRTLIILVTAIFLLCIPWTTTHTANSSGFVASGSTRRLNAQPQRKKVRLQITVKDTAIDGKPVANARVNVWHNRVGFLSGTSDYQGDTTPEGVAVIVIETTGGFFSGKPQLNLVIRVVKTDFEVKEDSINLSGNIPDEVTRTITIRKFAVQAGEMTMNIRVETWDGRPVPGASVYVWANTWPTRKNFNGITNDRGNAEVRTMRFDDFEIKASKEGLGEASMPAKVPGTGEIPTAHFTVKLPKPNGSVVTVVVKDKETQRSVADAIVIVNGSRPYSGVTGADGKAIIVIPETGSLAVNISQRTYEAISGAQMSLSGGEGEKTLEFELKPKPAKEGEGQNPIEVTVLAADKEDKSAVARSNLPLPFASVKVGRATAPTDAGGRVKIYGDFEGDVEVVVEAGGYKRQARSVRVRPTTRFSGSHASATFLMQAEESRDYVEVKVVEEKENCSSHCPPMEGVTITAGGTTAVTNAEGKAILYGFFDDENIRAQKVGYKSQVQQVSSSRSSDGVARGALTFRLKAESAEITVEILVFGVSPKDGSTFPISNAAVKIGQKVASTDENGRARLKGEFTDGSEVVAQARGYVRQATRLSVGKLARDSTATIYLKPEMPIRLIVEVLDSAQPNNPLARALVHLRDPQKPVEGTSPLAVQETNAQGEAAFEIRGSEEELLKARAGLRLQIGKEKYKAKLSDVTADRLQPSTEARRVTVYLERDWDELRKDIAALEAKVVVWRNDGQEHRTKIVRLQEHVQLAKAFQQSAESLSQEVQSAAEAFGLAVGPGLVGARCQKVTQLKEKISVAEAEANQKAQDVKQQLDAAATVVANCSVAGDAEVIRSSYKAAIRLVAEIGSLEKQAVADRNSLLILKQENDALKNLLAEVARKVEEIEQKHVVAENLVKQAEADFKRASELSNTLVRRQVALKAELAVLEVKHEIGTVTGLPPDLSKRVDAIRGMLGSENNNVSFAAAPDAAPLTSVRDAAAQIGATKQQSKKSLAIYKGAICDFEGLDNLVDEIGTTLTIASLMLRHDLPRQADECARKAACMLLIEDIRSRLQNDTIEAAEARANEARAKECDVSSPDGEFRKYRSIRDAIMQLDNASKQCKFQEGMEFAGRLPASYQNDPKFASALTQLRAGARTQQQVEQFITQATNAAVQGSDLSRHYPTEQAKIKQHFVQADGFLAQADQAAAPYPCLVDRVNRYRVEYDKLKKSSFLKDTAPPVEEIPDALGNNPGQKQTPTDDVPVALARPTGVLGSPVHKPPVEEIPETITPTERTGNTGRPGDRRSGQPLAEEIPEAVTPTGGQQQGNNPLSGNNPPPGVRPCTADESALFSRMTGTWRAGGPKITISGSCEQASGTMTWAEYCEDPDATYNRSLPRYTGKFTGRMEGGSLQLKWDLPGGSVHPDRKGTASCSLNSDGTLRCSGFGCNVGGKKQ